jgi:hypothetical protein
VTAIQNENSKVKRTTHRKKQREEVCPGIYFTFLLLNFELRIRGVDTVCIFCSMGNRITGFDFRFLNNILRT